MPAKPKGRPYTPNGIPRLTEKQEAFVKHYLDTGNASEAYRRAYDVSPTCKPNTIEKRACELLKLGKVAGRVSDLQGKIRKIAEDRYLITKERVLGELARIGFANMQDYLKTDGDAANFTFDFSTLTRDQFAAIGEVTVEDIDTGARKGKRTKFKLLDKQTALVKLGQEIGLFKQTGDTQVNFNVTVTDARNSVSRKLNRLVDTGAERSLAEQPIAGRA